MYSNTRLLCDLFVDLAKALCAASILVNFIFSRYIDEGSFIQDI